MVGMTMYAEKSLERSGISPSFLPIAANTLPIFLYSADGYAAYYSPGCLCVLPVSLAAETEDQIFRLSAVERSTSPRSTKSHPAAREAASRLVEAARTASNEVTRSARVPFLPECLTLFMNNTCNLRCGYCHSTPGARADSPISDEAIKTAGDLVAAVCAQQRRPFTIVFHGGGEPSLDERQVDHALDILHRVARTWDVPPWTYVATNGVMPQRRAEWLARRFDLLGLSCDGPPDIQDRQRPARDGCRKSSIIRRTAAVLRQAGKPFHVRATITKDTVARQAEVASYLIEELVPAEVRLEPAHTNPAGDTVLGPAAAPDFVAGFMAARGVAAASRALVTTSMTRPASLYGRHCNVLRGVLNLVPGDIATGCFLESRGSGIARRGVRIGAANPGSRSFDLDTEHIKLLTGRSSEIPSSCRGCLCSFQCTYGCPDVCALGGPEHQEGPAGHDGIRTSFRCHANRLLMEALLREAAEIAWRATLSAAVQETPLPPPILPVTVYR